MPGPGVGVGGCLRVVARGMAVGGRFRGASGTPPPTGCPGMGGNGRSRRGGAPRPTDGDMETLWGLRGQSFLGRRAVGAGHARPGGWREHPSMVRPVGRGLDPSAGGYPGDGRWREVSGASGTPPPTACPGTGGSGRSRRGGGTPPYGWGYGNARGVYTGTRSRGVAR